MFLPIEGHVKFLGTRVELLSTGEVGGRALVLQWIALAVRFVALPGNWVPGVRPWGGTA